MKMNIAAGIGFSLACLSACHHALADPVGISVTGLVYAAPCTVDVDTVSKQVELGRVIAHNIKEPGTGSDWKDFQLKLINCPDATNSATATFSGQVDDKDPTTYKNQGDAQNVSLQMTSADHATIYGSGSQMTMPVNKSTAQVIFPLAARVYSPLGNATGGAFSAAVTIEFTYQ